MLELTHLWLVGTPLAPVSTLGASFLSGMTCSGLTLRIHLSLVRFYSKAPGPLPLQSVSSLQLD